VAPESSSIPKTPLPDLRQGIPSTFEDEFLKKSQGSERPPIDITDADPETSRSGGGGRGDGEIPKGAYESSIDKKRNALANYIALTVLLMGLGGTLYLGRNWDNEAEERAHSEAPSGWGFKLFYDRVMARVSGQMGYYTEPAFPKLLPVLTDQPTPPYTLVISLEDMLVHSEWTREHGWRTAKRPGADFFLLYLSQYYEICLFTSMPSATADPIYRRLDPYHVIMWPLFREATRYENGEYIKVSPITAELPARSLSSILTSDTARISPTSTVRCPAQSSLTQSRHMLVRNLKMQSYSLLGRVIPRTVTWRP
jgi:import inner membrane translocase subunit TIM50